MTNQTQGHTKGPWANNGRISDTNSNLLIFSTYDNHMIAKVSHEDPDEEEANARLIAASPELLEALKDLVDTCEMNAFISSTKSFNKSKQAIAKAEGNV